MPNPSEVAGVLEALAPATYKQIKTEMDFQKHICGDPNLKEIKVHPRFEMFAENMMTPPYQRPCRAVLYVDITNPEYEMHLVYADYTKIIELNRDVKE